MFRNQYDSDVTVWSPQGRLHQVDYAVEAMKQGSATVGICSKTHAVLVALKRAANELCSHQKKIFEVDKHVGVSVAGLLSDGRILTYLHGRFLQSQCTEWTWDNNEPIPVQVLSNRIQLKLQGNTQNYGRRPFGVGLVLAAYDAKGPHCVKIDPSAEVVETRAISIGARSQSARTYLERNVDEFDLATIDELIEHALLALRDTLPQEENLTKQVCFHGHFSVHFHLKNTSVAIVGKDYPFSLLSDDQVQPHLNRVGDQPRSGPPENAVKSTDRMQE